MLIPNSDDRTSPSNNTTTNSTKHSDSAFTHSESHSADSTQVTQTTQHDHNTRSKRDIPSTPNRMPAPAFQRLTQLPTGNLTRTPIDDLFTQPAAPAQPPEIEVDALMHEQQPHLKPVSTSATPPPKKSRSAQKRLEKPTA